MHSGLADTAGPSGRSSRLFPHPSCRALESAIHACKYDSCHATIIPFRTDPLSSELGSQPELGCISTGERDHLGTRSVVVFCRLLRRFCTALRNRRLAAHRHTCVMFQPPTIRILPSWRRWLQTGDGFGIVSATSYLCRASP